MEVDDSEEVKSMWNVYMEDLATVVRTVATHCKTIRDIGVHLVRSIPGHCHRCYVMVNSYRGVKIKTAERKGRGEGQRTFFET